MSFISLCSLLSCADPSDRILVVLSSLPCEHYLNKSNICWSPPHLGHVMTMHCVGGVQVTRCAPGATCDAGQSWSQKPPRLQIRALSLISHVPGYQSTISVSPVSPHCRHRQRISLQGCNMHLVCPPHNICIGLPSANQSKELRLSANRKQGNLLLCSSSRVQH